MLSVIFSTAAGRKKTAAATYLRHVGAIIRVTLSVTQAYVLMDLYRLSSSAAGSGN